MKASRDEAAERKLLLIVVQAAAAHDPGRVKIAQLGTHRRISRPPSFQFGGIDLSSQWHTRSFM
jgi:hypothetical protein